MSKIIDVIDNPVLNLRTTVYVADDPVTERPSDYLASRKFWTPARERILVNMLGQGRSRREMAGALGTTRNACIGKLRRMGLSTPMRPRDGSEEARNRRLDRRNELAKLRAIARKEAGLPRRLRPAWKPRPRAAEPVEAVSGGPVTVVGLTEKTCRWPLWTDERDPHRRMYCGAEVIEGSPYCTLHLKVSRR